MWRWDGEEGDGLLPGYVRISFTGDGSSEGLDGGRVEQEPVRPTVASECNDFVVLRLCQRVQKTPCVSNIVVTLSAKWVAKTRYTYGHLKGSTNSDSLLNHHPLLPLRSTLRVQSRCPETLQNRIIMLRDTM